MNNEQINMDFLGHGEAQGEIAGKFMANGELNPGKMRPYVNTKDGKVYISVFKGGDPKKPENYQAVPINTNATTLRPYEWRQLDQAIIGIAENRLNGVNDLISNGLVYNLGNGGMGTTVLESHSVSDAYEADLTMDGLTRSKNDRPVYTTTYLPIPIIHVDYEINTRVLAASRNMGNALDTTAAERAARRVAEKLESMLFTDTSYAFGGGTIYSYLNHPNINSASLNYHWNDSGATGATIIDDVLTMKQASINDYFYGPWMLYIPTAYETVLDADYDTSTPGTTIRERILKIAGIKDVKVVDTLTADKVLLVQMTSDVVRLVRGMGLTNIQWGEEGNMVTKYKVMTIQVPQIRSDYNGRSGIVLATK